MTAALTTGIAGRTVWNGVPRDLITGSGSLYGVPRDSWHGPADPQADPIDPKLDPLDGIAELTDQIGVSRDGWHDPADRIVITRDLKRVPDDPCTKNFLALRHQREIGFLP